jgi:hypothetical protein
MRRFTEIETEPSQTSKVVGHAFSTSFSDALHSMINSSSTFLPPITS